MSGRSCSLANSVFFKTLSVLIILFFICVSFSSSFPLKTTILSNSEGLILYVGGSGPGNYTNIQDAINETHNGDTVFVFNGTYNGHVYINKSINLFGEDKNTTIITGYVAYTVSIVTDWVNMSEFTINNNERMGEGVRIDSSHTNFKNNIIDTSNDNVRLFGYYNVFSKNTIYCDSLIITGDGNKISDNVITNDYHGIVFSSSNYNIISNNSFFKSGLFFSDYKIWNNIVINNTMNNRPLIFINNESNIIFDGAAGQLILVNCTNITIKNQELFNTTVGIQILNSNNCRITNNNIYDNLYGIFFNQLSENNKIYRNNLMNNTCNGFDNGNNYWDSFCGNYWDDYGGTDENGDGIGDIPYQIPGEDNVDRYPLMDKYIETQPPNSPTIEGPYIGKPGITYNFTFSSTDPDGDYIFYRIDWGQYLQITGPYRSGSTIDLPFSWADEGEYIIRCWCRDIYGELSEVSVFDITIPRNRNVPNQFFLRVLDRHPIIKGILKIIFNFDIL